MTCSPEQFECPNHRCIASTLRCNGYSDCRDGADEKDCRKCCCNIQSLFWSRLHACDKRIFLNDWPESVLVSLQCFQNVRKFRLKFSKLCRTSIADRVLDLTVYCVSFKPKPLQWNMTAQSSLTVACVETFPHNMPNWIKGAMQSITRHPTCVAQTRDSWMVRLYQGSTNYDPRDNPAHETILSGRKDVLSVLKKYYFYETFLVECNISRNNHIT